VFLCLVSGLYAWAAYAPWTPPWVVSGFALDDRIPFRAWAAWPYASYLAVLPALIAVARRWPGFARVAGTGMLCALANAAVFALLPTRLASRPAAPADTLLAWIQRIDPPACAIPSGHVALPVSIGVAALLAAATSRRRFAGRWRALAGVYFGWAVVLGSAAVLSGQHYLVDIGAGIAFGTAVALAMAVARSREVHASTLAAACLEWGLAAAACAAAVRWWGLTAVVAGAFVATRQHALLILYHDGVHGLVARRLRLNDLLVNLFAGVPLLLPIHIYRGLHLAHHRHLGGELDPERRLLYRGQPWRYRPLVTAALARQLAGDLLLWNALRTSWRYARDRELRESLPATGWRVELPVLFALFAGGWIAGAVAAPEATWRVALVWFVPYLTLTQLLNKLRSFGEHAEGETGGAAISCSWAPGLLGRLTLWPYNTNFHREHHRHPELPWDSLPSSAEGSSRRPGWELLARVWQAGSRARA
jgi:fatty acid desaturase